MISDDQQEAVVLSGVGKMYRIHRHRRDAILDAFGMSRLTRGGPSQEFWALRGIDLTLHRGKRLGIIGRNGAGKSTLLRLLTENVRPTEGTVTVRGEVQALMDAGEGFHPEFTGRENVRAALSYQGLTSAEIHDAQQEIADFTELGTFIDQPLKTYSAGMQARLSFAVATTVRPEILIVDEILGAGDAYFFGKSMERMRALVDHGATAILVSHALDQVTRFCEEAIWIDRGRVVRRGQTIEVVKAYEKFSQDLEARRLRANNAKSRKAGDGFRRDTYTDHLTLQLLPSAASYCSVAELRLKQDGADLDSIAVGDAQDSDGTQPAHITLGAGSGWSAPRQDDDRFFRTITSGLATATFALWLYFEGSDYEAEFTYCTGDDAWVQVEILRNQERLALASLPGTAGSWERHTVSLGTDSGSVSDPDRGNRAGPDISRWQGREDLTIESVAVVDASGHEQVVLKVFEPASLQVRLRANCANDFRIIPICLVFREDGLVVMRHIGSAVTMRLEHDATVDAQLDFGPLLLGNGRYLVTVGVYEHLVPTSLEESTIYEVLDRSYEFRVVGNVAPHDEIVRHPGEWVIDGESLDEKALLSSDDAT